MNACMGHADSQWNACLTKQLPVRLGVRLSHAVQHIPVVVPCSGRFHAAGRDAQAQLLRLDTISHVRDSCAAVRIWGVVAATPQRSPRFEAIWVTLPICRNFMAKLYGPRNTLIRASSPPGAIWYLCWHTTCNLMQQLMGMPVAVLQWGRQSTGLLLLLTLQRHGMAVDRARDRGTTCSASLLPPVAAATQIRLQTTCSCITCLCLPVPSNVSRHDTHIFRACEPGHLAHNPPPHPALLPCTLSRLAFCSPPAPCAAHPGAARPCSSVARAHRRTWQQCSRRVMRTLWRRRPAASGPTIGAPTQAIVTPCCAHAPCPIRLHEAAAVHAPTGTRCAIRCLRYRCHHCRCPPAARHQAPSAS